MTVSQLAIRAGRDGEEERESEKGPRKTEESSAHLPRGMAQADEHVEIEEYLHIVRMHVLSAFDYLSG